MLGEVTVHATLEPGREKVFFKIPSTYWLKEYAGARCFGMCHSHYIIQQLMKGLKCYYAL